MTWNNFSCEVLMSLKSGDLLEFKSKKNVEYFLVLSVGPENDFQDGIPCKKLLAFCLKYKYKTQRVFFKEKTHEYPWRMLAYEDS